MKFLCHCLRSVCFVVFSLSGVSFAGEAALYAEVPLGSSLIRIFNGHDTLLLDSAQLGGKDVGSITPFSASDYVWLPPGEHLVKTNIGELKIKLGQSKLYTLVVKADKSYRLIEDKNFESKRKALISFYNLVSDVKLSLKTANGNTMVIEDVVYEKIGVREIKAVKVALSAFQDNQKLADADPLVLERGKVFSLFACGSLERPRLVWVENKLNASI